MAVQHHGYCSTTLAHEGSGDCETGEQGILILPGSLTPDRFAHECRAACLRCHRCRYISFSLQYRECGWFQSCQLDDLRTKHPFVTVVVRNATTPLSWVNDSTLRVGNIQRAARQADRWLRNSRPGFCAHIRSNASGLHSQFQPVGSSGADGSPPVEGVPSSVVPCLPEPRPQSWQSQRARHLICAVASDGGDCNTDAAGVFYFESPASNWTNAAQRCLHRCHSCKRCHALSVARHVCTWHSECDLGGLFLLPDTWRSAHVANHDRARRPLPQLADAPVPQLGPSVSQRRPRSRKASLFAFYVQVLDEGCALAELLTSIRRWYSRVPVYVWTDHLGGGGRNYSELCGVHSCVWRYSLTPAGHHSCLKWYAAREAQTAAAVHACAAGYLSRMLETMALCRSTFLINLEGDTCLHRHIDVLPPADGDIGGLPHPIFPERFVAWVRGRLPPSQASRLVEPAVWGCSGGCYYRVASFLRAMEAYGGNVSIAAAPLRLAAEQLSMPGLAIMDVAGPAIAMLLGLRVRPWSAVSDGRTRLPSLSMVNVPHEDRILEHKCTHQQLRRRACGQGGGKWSELRAR
jgi:hypothetical protein